MERYNDIIEAESVLEFQKGDIIKIAIPANRKDDFIKYDEFLIFYPTSNELYDYVNKNSFIEVEIFIKYVTQTRQNLLDIVPIYNNRFVIDDERFYFNYIYLFDEYVDDELQFENGLTTEEYEEWFKKVYEKEFEPNWETDSWLLRRIRYFLFLFVIIWIVTKGKLIKIFI